MDIALVLTAITIALVLLDAFLHNANRPYRSLSNDKLEEIYSQSLWEYKALPQWIAGGYITPEAARDRRAAALEQMHLVTEELEKRGLILELEIR